MSTEAPHTLSERGTIQESKPSRIEKIKPWLEIVGGTVLVATLIASLYANHLSRQALTASQRAWVGIQSISATPPSAGEMTITYKLQNFADSPALDIQHAARVGGTHPAEELQYMEGSRLDALMPHETRDSEFVLNGAMATNVFSGKGDVIVILIYRDIFGDKHSYVATMRSISGRMMVVSCDTK